MGTESAWQILHPSSGQVQWDSSKVCLERKLGRNYQRRWRVGCISIYLRGSALRYTKFTVISREFIILHIIHIFFLRLIFQFHASKVLQMMAGITEASWTTLLMVLHVRCGHHGTPSSISSTQEMQPRMLLMGSETTTIAETQMDAEQNLGALFLSVQAATSQGGSIVMWRYANHKGEHIYAYMNCGLHLQGIFSFTTTHFFYLHSNCSMAFLWNKYLWYIHRK